MKKNHALFLCCLLSVFQPTLAASHEINCDPNSGTVLAVDWVQSSGEYAGLCYQIFRSARLQLDENLKNYALNKTPAIVLDIDETVLNNNLYAGHRLKTKTPFISKEWTAWVKMQKATAISGALEFLKYAHKKNLAIFYVTNRNLTEKTATISNLKALGFPQADAEHVLVKTDTMAKQARFDQIAQQYGIIMWFGDSLSDFGNMFNGLAPEKRQALVNELKQEFGKRFILLPNPTYGSWEDAILVSHKLSCKEQNDKLLNVIKSY